MSGIRAGIEIARLPCGFRERTQEGELKYHKSVVIDHRSGWDDENMSDTDLTSGGDKAIIVLLRRLIQEIPGFLPRKDKLTSLIDEDLILNLDQSDVDTILIDLMISEGRSLPPVPLSCDCGGETAPVPYSLKDLPFRGLEEGDEHSVPFTLKYGLREGERVYKTGRLRFPKVSDTLAVAPLTHINAHKALSKLLSVLVEFDRPEGEPDMPVSQSMISSLYRDDRNRLQRCLEEGSPGYDRTLKGICLTCKGTVRRSINPMDFFDLEEKVGD